MARQFYDDIFVVLNVETLDDAKFVFKSMMEEKDVYILQNNEIKSLKKLLVDVEADEVALEKKLMDTEARLVRAQNSSKGWCKKYDNLQDKDVLTIKNFEGKVNENATLEEE